MRQIFRTTVYASALVLGLAGGAFAAGNSSSSVTGESSGNAQTTPGVSANQAGGPNYTESGHSRQGTVGTKGSGYSSGAGVAGGTVNGTMEHPGGASSTGGGQK
jgi:hypothetical protein